MRAIARLVALIRSAVSSDAAGDVDRDVAIVALFAVAAIALGSLTLRRRTS